MKTLLAMAVGALVLLSAGVSLAQNGSMMDDGAQVVGWMDAYGAKWVPLLLVLALVGLAALLVRHKGHANG